MKIRKSKQQVSFRSLGRSIIRAYARHTTARNVKSEKYETAEEEENKHSMVDSSSAAILTVRLSLWKLVFCSFDHQRVRGGLKSFIFMFVHCLVCCLLTVSFVFFSRSSSFLLFRNFKNEIEILKITSGP